MCVCSIKIDVCVCVGITAYLCPILLNSLEYELSCLNAAFGGRLRRELAEYVLGLRLVVREIPPRLRKHTDTESSTGMQARACMYSKS